MLPEVWQLSHILLVNDECHTILCYYNLHVLKLMKTEWCNTNARNGICLWSCSLAAKTSSRVNSSFLRGFHYIKRSKFYDPSILNDPSWAFCVELVKLSMLPNNSWPKLQTADKSNGTLFLTFAPCVIWNFIKHIIVRSLQCMSWKVRTRVIRNMKWMIASSLHEASQMKIRKYADCLNLSIHHH